MITPPSTFSACMCLEVGEKLTIKFAWPNLPMYMHDVLAVDLAGLRDNLILSFGTGLETSHVIPYSRIVVRSVLRLGGGGGR